MLNMQFPSSLSKHYKNEGTITQSHIRLKQHFSLLCVQYDGYPKETKAIYRCSLLPAQTCLLSALAWQDLVSDPNQRCGNQQSVIRSLCTMELDQTVYNMPSISQILDLMVLFHIYPDLGGINQFIWPAKTQSRCSRALPYLSQ